GARRLRDGVGGTPNEDVTVISNNLSGGLSAFGIRADSHALSGTVSITDTSVTGNGTGIDLANFTTLDVTNLTLTGNTTPGSVSGITTVNLTTTNSADTINVNGAGSTFGVGVGNSVVQPISFSSITGLNVFALTGNDRINVSPHAATTIAIHGGAPTTPPGDILNLDLTGVQKSLITG